MANISLIYVQSKVGLPVVNRPGVRQACGGLLVLRIYNIYFHPRDSIRTFHGIQ
jgi:hypothetical protein